MNQSYIYTTLLLHEEGKEINQQNVENILTSVDAEVNESKIKALIASLEDVDISNALRGDFSPPKHPRKQLDTDIEPVQKQTKQSTDEENTQPELEAGEEQDTPELTAGDDLINEAEDNTDTEN